MLLGEACSKQVQACWHGTRPTGALVYFSLPFRVGLGAEWTIVGNALAISASIALGFLALVSLLPSPTRLHRIVLAGVVLFAHLWFAGALITNTLSDLPAASVALASIWTLMLAASAASPWLYAASGFALGLCTTVRAFYLYPALICVVTLLATAAWRRRGRTGALGFACALAVPVLVQVTLTHHFTGAWAFIDPSSAAHHVEIQLKNITYGYDTLLPARGAPYDAVECFRTSKGMLDAVSRHAWTEIGCLVLRREWFYFGSYTIWGRVYLSNVDERHYSVLVLVANASMMAVSCAWAILRARRTPEMFAVLAFLGAILGEASAIRPEARFLIALQVAAWAIGGHALIAFVLDRVRASAR